MADFKFDWEIDYGIGYRDALDRMSAEQNTLASTKIRPDITKSMHDLKASLAPLSGGMMMVVGGMGQIAIINDEQMKALRTIALSVNVAFAGLMIYDTIAQLRKAELIPKMSAAIAETAAMVVAQRYDKIALATATAAGVSVAFAGGFYLGKMESVQYQNKNVITSGDISTPQGRREIVAVAGGG